jgi:AcrR family transcriptional regulator
VGNSDSLTPASPEGSSEPRKTPVQQRSRARVERILATASALIARDGSDRLTMSELAAGAGVSIGSLYQYFPEKSAIIRVLADRYHDASRQCIQSALSGVHDIDALQGAFAELFQTYFRIIRAEPVMRDIWSGMQADKHLMERELAESRACSTMLADAIARARPALSATTLATPCFLIWQLGESAIRLAISLDALEADQVVASYIRMSWREIASW